MLSLLGTLIVGFIVGLIARAIMPGVAWLRRKLRRTDQGPRSAAMLNWQKEIEQ